MTKFLIVSCLAFAALAARADIVLYATGFEPPTYSLGPLDGQDGWVQDIGPTSNITVQDTVVRSGSQAVQVMAASAPDFTRAVRFIDYDTTTNSSKLVRFETGMLVQEAGEDSGYRVVGFSEAGILSELVVQPSGMISLLDGGGQFDTGVAFVRDVWHLVALDYDFATQTYDAFIDGLQIGNDRPFSVANVFLALALEVLPMGVGTDSAYFDDLSVTLVIAPVPEPPTAALALLAVVAVAAGRRRRAQAPRAAGA